MSYLSDFFPIKVENAGTPDEFELASVVCHITSDLPFVKEKLKRVVIARKGRGDWFFADTGCIVWWGKADDAERAYLAQQKMKELGLMP